MKYLILLGSAFWLYTACTGEPEYRSVREHLDLSGEWTSNLGPCRLPGTTDENRLGDGRHPTDVTYQLTRLYPYRGKAEYTRDIEIPNRFVGKRLALFMERTKPSTLWIDGDSIGSFGHIYAPHRYDLPALRPGKHRIKIRIDNSPTSVPAEIQGSHAWTDATQTNWNGILGDFYVEAVDSTFLESVRIDPDVRQKKARVRLLVQADRDEKATLRIEGHAWNTDTKHRLKDRKEEVRLQKGKNEVEIELDMGEKPLLWSEFHPALYRLNVSLEGKTFADNRIVDFGMREFSTSGTQFTVNGYKTFLRGKHDACVFPLTGYAPTDVESWRRVFRIAKSYGINHYRCHSYTPTRAAFEAADQEGIYFQAELPLWGSIRRENTVLNDFLVREAKMILDCFGNHPSFMMLGLGNELNGDTEVMRAWLDDFRRQDGRRLYCFGSNNYLGWSGPQEGEDYFVTCRVGGGEGYSTHVRTSFAFVDAEKGGILNNTRPNTRANYAQAIARSPRPVVSHESGQFQVYPDYAEIAKYTGVLYPYNLEIFRERLKENGLSEQAEDFHRASGRFALACYKADMEYCFRTPGFGGFQLLDLQDFPGQGSALVGMLDAFMDSKGIVEPEDFRNFCSPVVPLALTDDYCLDASQPFVLDVAVANYEENEWDRPVRWSLQGGGIRQQGEVAGQVGQGEVKTTGRLELSLTDVNTPSKLDLTLETGRYRNTYSFWVYPGGTDETGPIYLTRRLDGATKQKLTEGASVLFIPDHRAIERQSVGGLFTPDYWNYAMFKSISENAGKEVSPGTLSILTDPAHPLFREFPTECHSDWQWWSILRNARPLVLNATRREYKPLIQVIDNVERNHKLGLVFEFGVEKGRLLICTSDLDAIADTPEGNQFRNALLRYMKSSDFRPSERLSWEDLNRLMTADVGQKAIVGVENLSDYTPGE